MMSELEKQEIINRVNAMSREEKELVASVIPVDICQNRITAEIERLLTLEKKVKSLSEEAYILSYTDIHDSLSSARKNKEE